MNILDYIEQPESPLSRRTRYLQLMDAMDQRKIRQMQMKEGEIRLSNLSQMRADEDARRQAYKAGTVPGKSAQLPAGTIDLGSLSGGQVALPGGAVERPAMQGRIGGGLQSVATPARIDRGAVLADLTKNATHLAPEMEASFSKSDQEEQERRQKNADWLRKSRKEERDEIRGILEINAQILGPILQLDPEVRPQAYAMLIRRAKQSGHLPAEFSEEYPGDDSAQFSLQQGLSYKEQLDAADKEQQRKQAATNAAETARHNRATEFNTIRGQNLTDARVRAAQTAAGERFEETKRRNAERERLARKALESAKEYRRRGQELKAIQMEMKAEGYLNAADDEVGFVDEALGSMGYETDDAREAEKARGMVGRIRGARTPSKGIGAPLPGAMETQTHPQTGEVFERRKGSNDPWKKRVRQ